MKKILSKIGYYFLIIVILLVGGFLLFSKLPVKDNFQVKIVLSGSMEPAVKMGSLAIIKPADIYKDGDIITFGKDSPKEVPTTHRIVETRAVNGEMRYITQGDANSDPDGKEVRENEIIGRVLLSLPYFGYILDLAKQPLGFAALIGIPALIIVGDEIAKIWKEIRGMRRRKRENLRVNEKNNVI